MALLIFILILSVLVLVHELGHFLVAKKNGILVEEFGLGIPPRLFGKKIGETLYSYNLLPFGGFVKLYGDDPEETTQDLETNPRSFLSKSPFQRAAVLLAGVLMNFVLAVFLYYLLFFVTNFKTLSLPVFFDYNFKYGEVNYTNTVVTGFIEGSTAKNAGVQAGEAISRIDGTPVSNISDIRDALEGKQDTQVSLVLQDMRVNSEVSTRELTSNVGTDEEGNAVLGVYISESASIHYSNKILAPVQHSINMIAYTGHVFGQFINASIQTKSVEPVSQGVAGPVGIYSVVDSILSYGGTEAYLGLIDFVALLSLSLAFLNLLPLPALDGGRFAFILFEIIFRKKPSQKVETFVHKWGMLFFFGLLILITVKDVRNLINF